MNFWSRTWAITKLSFDVIKKDPEMLAFPALAAVLSLVFGIAMLFPTVLIDYLHASDPNDVVFGPLQLLATFSTYFGLAFISTFSNVCVVYTTKTRLEGGDATFGESIRFAFSRFGRIFSWSLVSASVGLLLAMMENAARNSKGAGRILLAILRSFLATAWTIVSLFVVPVMVYRDLGPFDALKASTETLRATWGESLVRHFGMGVASFLFVLPGILVLVGVTYALSAGLPPAVAMVLYAFAVLYLLGVTLVFGVANSVYNTALYHFASSGQIPAGFTDETIRGAFGSSGR